MKYILVFILLALSSQSFSAVWQTKNKWDNNQERRYEHWVRTQWRDDIFTKGRYAGISTDCADATYTMRLIFAYENKLPFVIKDYSRPGKTINNRMTRWDSKSTHRKFISFVNYVNNMTSTKSLPGDTYPAAVNRAGFASGAAYVSPGTHSYQIVSMNRYGVLTVGASTVPRKVRDLFFENTFPQYVPGEKVHDYSDGYRRFRTPENLYTSIQNIPGASLEQFNMAKHSNYAYMVFTDKIVQKLSNLREPIGAKASRMQWNVSETLMQRDPIIWDGFEALQKIRATGRKCMNYGEYDSHSTPSRDGRLKQSFVHLKSLITSPQYKARWNDTREWNSDEIFVKRALEYLFLGGRNIEPWKKQQIANLNTFTPSGLYRTINMYDIWYAILDGRLSHDPNNSIAARWGFEGRVKSGCKNW